MSTSVSAAPAPYVPSSHDNPAAAAIEFALMHRDLDLLRLWNEGEFERIRTEWPDAPDAMFIGADPLLRAAAGTDSTSQMALGPAGSVAGELMEIGDDEGGQPRLVIHSTRDQIRNGGLIPFQAVHVVPSAVTASAAPAKCWCLTCRPQSLADMRFVVCPTCGNKRCPKANNHQHECSGSNEPGQKGSAFETAATFAGVDERAIEIAGRYAAFTATNARTMVSADNGRWYSRDSMLAAITDSLRERDKLQAFKDYVHGRLDQAGIPVDPPSEHRDAGCRIGGRLDIALSELPGQLEREVRHWLDSTPGAVRVCEGGGPEEIAKSFAVTVTRLTNAPSSVDLAKLTAGIRFHCDEGAAGTAKRLHKWVGEGKYRPTLLGQTMEEAATIIDRILGQQSVNNNG